MQVEPQSPANVLPFVWDGDAPLIIESVTVRRRVVRETGRGGMGVIEMSISLPRVRFLEEPEDPTSSASDTTDVLTVAAEEAPRLAA